MFRRFIGLNGGKSTRRRRGEPRPIERLEPRRLLAFGEPDFTFGIAGTALQSRIGEAAWFDLVNQPDGKLVSVGETLGGDTTQLVIARSSVNGSLDLSFGENGIAVLPTELGASGARTIKLQGDGSYLVGGYVSRAGQTQDLALFKFTALGKLDPSFGMEGIATADVSGNADLLWDITITPTGNILGAGISKIGNTGRGAVAKWTSQGILDRQFGTAGTYVAQASRTIEARTIELDAQGRILVAGSQIDSTSSIQPWMTRLTANGELDPTFGSAGVLKPALGGIVGAIRSMIIDSGNKLLVVGYSDRGFGRSFAVNRLSLEGQQDATWNNGQPTVLKLEVGNDEAWDVAQDSQGRVIVGGNSTVLNGQALYSVARFQADGTADESFGIKGVTATTVVVSNSGDVNGYALAIDSSDRVLQAGMGRLPSGNRVAAIARYQADSGVSVPADRYEPNNQSTAATNLGETTGTIIERNLTAHQSGDRDWFQFQLISTGTVENTIELGFRQSSVDLDLELYRLDGTLIASSATVENGEDVSLDGLAAGSYRIQVIQRGGSGFYTMTLKLPGSTPDPFEQNGTRQTATDLYRLMGSGSKGSLTLHRQTDEDWFRFETVGLSGPADQIELRSVSDIAVTNLVFELYDATGTRLIVSSANTTGRLISMSQRPAGVYFMRVTGASVQTGVPYQLTWRLPTPLPDTYEPSDGLGSANDLGLLASPRQITGLTIHQSNDDDWFRFVIPDGAANSHQIAARFVHNDGDVDLELLDDQGKTIRFSQSRDDDELIDLSGLSGGEYYLHVYTFEEELSPGYRLEFTPPSIQPDSREPNNTRQTAFALPVGPQGSLARNTLHSTTDEDWFQFSLSSIGRSGDEIRVASTQAYGDVQAELYNSQGNLISRSVSSRDFETLSLTALASGTYSVRVLGAGGALSSRYDLSWQIPGGADRFEPNESRSNPTQLGTLSGMVSTRDLSLHQVQDEDWFSFTLPLIQSQEHGVVVVSPQSASVLQLELWSASGTKLAESSDRYLSLGGLPADSYGLRVRGNGGELPNYALQWNLSAQGNDSREPNNQSNIATPLGTLRLPITVDNLQVGPNDQDWFQFDIEALGRVTDLVRLNATSADAFDFELWQNGQFVRGASSEGNDRVLSLDGLPIGTYFIRVASQNKGAGYRLIFTPPEPLGGWDALEPNNQLQSAVQLGSIVGGLQRDRLTLHSASDEDWFRFSLPINASFGHQIFVNLESNRSEVVVELRANDGTLLRSVNGAGPLLKLSLDGLAAGAYQLKVASQIASQGTFVPTDYRLEILGPETRTDLDPFEPNESAATAKPIPIAVGHIDLTQLTLHPADTADWYSFSLTQNSNPTDFVRLSAQTRSGVRLRLTSENGQTLQETTLYQPGQVELSLAALTAGNYRIAVSPLAGVADPRGTFYQLSFELGNTPVARDRFEPNDTLSTPIALGPLVSNPRVDQLTLVDANDVDVFSFQLSNAAESSHLAIIADRLDAELTIDLYDDTQRYLRSASGIGHNQNLLLNGLDVGTYRLLIRSRDGIPTRYSLSFVDGRVATVEDSLEPNDSVGSAYSLQRLSDRLVASELHVSTNDEDWFRMQLGNPGTFADRIVVRYQQGGSIPEVRLYRASDQQLQRNAAVYAGFSELNLAGLPATDYYLQVTSTGSVEYQLETITSSSTNTAADPAEPNQTRITATALGSVDQPLTAGPFRSVAADEDWFVFNTTAVGTLRNQVALLFDRRLGGLKAELQDSSGQLLTKSNGVDGILVFSLDNRPAGQYFLKVENTNSSAPYHLVLLPPSTPLTRSGADWAEPNQEAITATRIPGLAAANSLVRNHSVTSLAKIFESLRPEGISDGTLWSQLKTEWDRRIDEQTDGSIVQAGSAGDITLSSLNLAPLDQDWFAFELTTAAEAEDYVSAELSEIGSGITLTLFAANDLSQPLRQHVTASNQVRISLTGLPFGSYRVRLDGAISPVAYQLKLRAPTSNASNLDVFEPNQSSSTPRDLGTIASSITYQGLTSSTTNDDWYAFQLSKPGVDGERIRVSTAGQFADIDVELYKADGSLVTKIAHRETESVLALGGLAAGSYRIRVSAPASAIPVSYSLEFFVSPPVIADRFESPVANNLEADATDLGTIDADRVLDGLTLSAGDLDIYRFNLASIANASSRLILETVTGSGLVGELLNDSGQVIRSSSSDPSSWISLEGLAVGSYRLRVRSNAGETSVYRLKFQPAITQLDWTFMVYLNAGANEAAARAELNRWESLAAQSGANVRFAIWLDQNSASVSEQGQTRAAQPFITPVKNGSPTVWSDTGRGFVAADMGDAIATSFERLGEKNSGSAASVTEFVNFAISNAPAKRYALYVWGAGSPISGSLTDFDPVISATTPDALQATELASALQTLKSTTLSGRTTPIDLLVLNSDVQATIESLLELGSKASVFVGNASDLHGAGIDVEQAWATWLQEPAFATPNDLGRAASESLTVNNGVAVAISGAQVTALQNAVRMFATKLTSGGGSAMNALRHARGTAALSDVYPEVRDLGKIAAYISSDLSLASDLRDAASTLVTAISNATLRGSASFDRSSVGVLLSNLNVPTNYASAFPVANQTNLTALLTAYVNSLDPTQKVVVADGNEGDSVQSHAIELGVIQSTIELPQRSLTQSDTDWYSFEIVQTLQGSDRFVLRNLGNIGTLQANLFDALGNQITERNASGAATVTLSLAGLVAGRYGLRVTANASIPYSLGWQITANSSSLPIDNVTFTKARELTTYNTTLLAAERVQPAEARFYKIGAARQPSLGHSVEIIPHSEVISASWLDGHGNVISTQSGSQPFRMKLPQGPVAFLRITLESGTTLPGFFTLQWIAPDGVAPKLIPLSVPSQESGAPIALTFAAIDESETAIRFELGSNAPAGATIHPATGVFNWTSNDIQSVRIPVIASDAAGNQNTLEYALKIHSAWQNQRLVFDVDDNQLIQAIDALYLINELNSRQTSEGVTGKLFLPAPTQRLFYDTDGDGKLFPIDVLLIINELNRGSGESATGEVLIPPGVVDQLFSRPGEQFFWREEDRRQPLRRSSGEKEWLDKNFVTKPG